MFEGKYRISVCVRRSGVSGLGTSSSLTSVEDTRVDDINLANLEGTQRLSKRDIVAIKPRSAAIITLVPTMAFRPEGRSQQTAPGRGKKQTREQHVCKSD